MRENIALSDWQDEQQLPNKDTRDLTFEERRAAEQAAKEIFGPAYRQSKKVAWKQEDWKPLELKVGHETITSPPPQIRRARKH